MLFSKEFRRQLLATLSVNILTVGFGVSIAWSSASLILLEHVDTPLPSGPLTPFQSSWVGSLLPLGGFCGNILCGLFGSHFGRKTVLVASAVSQFTGWFLIYIAKDVYYLYGGRFLQGLCGACVYAILPIFVAEISDTRIRGTLGSMLMLSSNVGILASFVLGHYVDYIIIPLVLMSVSVAFMLAMVFQHETPPYLLRAGLQIESERSLRYYRNLDKESQKAQESLQCEMEILKISCLPASKMTNDVESSKEDSVTWRDFVTPAARKALIIGLFLLWLKQFAGLTVMVFYAGHIFAASGSSITPNMAAIVIGVVQLIGTYTSSLLVDRLGRKVLLMISTVGTGTSLLALATFTYLQSIEYEMNGFGWVPMVCASSVLYLGSCGMLPMPFVVLSEIMPTKIRSSGASIGMTSLWGFGVVVIICYPHLLMLIGMHGCLCFFAACAFIGAIFVKTYMFETKGKSFEEISVIMEGRRTQPPISA